MKRGNWLYAKGMRRCVSCAEALRSFDPVNLQKSCQSVQEAAQQLAVAPKQPRHQVVYGYRGGHRRVFDREKLILSEVKMIDENDSSKFSATNNFFASHSTAKCKNSMSMYAAGPRNGVEDAHFLQVWRRRPISSQERVSIRA